MADIDLTDAITALMQHEWEPGHDYSPRSAHTQHGTWDRCAVCRGDVARILEVVAPLLIEQGRRQVLGELTARMDEPRSALFPLRTVQKFIRDGGGQ